MAITDLNTIKNWFKRGLKPTEAQFWATWDSYWHKSESIPTTAVAGLDDYLNAKVDKKDITLPSLYNPLVAYSYSPEAQQYVSYHNPQSVDVQYQYEGFYRLLSDAAVEESPESHPSLWSYQGSVWGEITIADVAGLQGELAGKASSVHTHDAGDIDGLADVLLPLTNAVADHESRLDVVEDTLADLHPPANYMLDIDSEPVYVSGRIRSIMYRYVSDPAMKYEERLAYDANGRIASVELRDDVSGKWVRRSYTYNTAGQLLLPTVANITSWSID